MRWTIFSSAVLAFSVFVCVTCFPNDVTNPAVQKLEEAQQEIEKNNFAEGIEKYKQAIQLYERQNDRKGIADVSHKLGVACSKLGKYSEGLDALNRSLKLHEELGDKSAVGMDLTRLAFIYSSQANYKKSLELSSQALIIHEKAGNQQGIADTLRVMGVVNEFQDNYDEALKNIHKAMEIYLTINDAEGIANSYGTIGGVYWKQGKLNEAMEQHKKGLEIAESNKLKGVMTKSLGNIGLIYWNLGDTKKAFEYYEKSQVIAHEIGNKRSESINLFNMAILHEENGNYKQSLDYFKNALDLAHELGDRGLEGVCLEELGEAFQMYGEYDIALDYFDRSLKIAHEIGEKRAAAFTYKAIGEIHETLENHKLAIDYFQKARQVYEQIGEKRGIGIAFENIARIHWKNGNYELALNDSMESLRIFESIGARAQMPAAYRMVGLAHLSKREFPEAEIALSKSIEIAKETGKVEPLWQALHNKGELLKILNKNEEALALMKESIVVLEGARQKVNVGEQRAQYFEDKVKVYRNIVQLLVSTGNSSEAFNYVQRSKARAFLDMLAESRVNQEALLEPGLLERKQGIESEMSQARRDIQSEHEKENVNRIKIADLQKRINDLEFEYSNLISEIRKQNPRYASIQYPIPLTLKDAQSLLDDRTVLLEYSIGDTVSWLFAVTNKDIAVFEMPSEKKLTEQVHNLREFLTKPDPTYQILEKSHSKYMMLAESMYSELIQPAQSVLQGKQRILIAPDAALNYLPFECLLTDVTKKDSIDFKTLPYLTRKFEISYVPSISVLSTIAKPDPLKKLQQKQLLAFADPQLRISSNDTSESPAAKVRGWVGTLGPLPHARAEAKAISSIYSNTDVTVLEGKSATEAKLKEMDLRTYRKLHFASHGLIDEERPEFSSLVLSPDESKKEDGFLTMREVFDLKLNAELVVLSACKTGLGKKIHGEGVTGISRAFFCAGTPNVVVSLWDVYDRSTADLMASFYEGMEVKKLNKAAALRDARLKMISSKKYSHPYYWSTFILFGNF